MSDHRPASWKWWVCGVLLLATMLMYMDRLTLAQTATFLKEHISLDNQRYAKIEAWFSRAFAVGAIVFGFIGDRFGPRRLYPVVLCGWSAAGIATSLATWPVVVTALGEASVPGQGEYYWLLGCRVVLGFFEGGHWPCAFLTVRGIMLAQDRQLGNSILQSGAAVGAILTPVIVQINFACGWPWQVPFVVLGLLGLLWLPIWKRTIQPSDIRQIEGYERKIIWGRLAVQMPLLAVVVIAISLAWQFPRAWMPKFLKEYHHYSELTANVFSSVYFGVADVGCLLFGGLAQWLCRKGVSVPGSRLITFSGCAVIIAAAWFVPGLERGPWLLMAMLLVAAGTLGAHPPYYSMAQELPPRHMGLLAGILSASSWFAVAEMQTAVGNHLEHTGSYALGFQIAGTAPFLGIVAIVIWNRVSRKWV